MSTFVIGDPHGQALLLDQLLARLPIHWEINALADLQNTVYQESSRISRK
jgi:hypothetical protein